MQEQQNHENRGKVVGGCVCMLVTQSHPTRNPIDCGHEGIKDSILTFNAEIFMRHRSESVNCAWHIFNSTF